MFWLCVVCFISLVVAGREANGSLLPNPAKFPSGMDVLSAHARSRGMSLGLYTTPGNYTCSGESGGGEPGSFGHVDEDVRLWVEGWRIGFLKDCVCNTTPALRSHAYADMRK